MIFTLPYPPLINRTYKVGNGKFYKSKIAKEWEEEVGWIINQSWKQQPLLGPVVVSLVMYWKNREPDIDGGIKITLDILERQHVIANDKQVKFLSIAIYQDPTWAHMEVIIEKL